MAIQTVGYVAEILYKVREEVLGTRFHFLIESAPSPAGAVKRLAEALEGRMPNLIEAFGSDAKLQCIKTAALGFGQGWSYEKPLRVTGDAATICIDEMLHLNLTMTSGETDGDIIVNRNQISGLPVGDVTNGRVSNDVQVVWADELPNWVNGSVAAGGFTFILACHRKTVGGHLFKTADLFKISPFVGTRIDRIKNRDNKGNRPAPVAPPA